MTRPVEHGECYQQLLETAAYYHKSFNKYLHGAETAKGPDVYVKLTDVFPTHD
jgi:hypothetical protein